MIDKLDFFYNIKIDNLEKKDTDYYFSINSYHFILKEYPFDIEKLGDILKLNNYLINYNFDRIILNRYGNPITQDNNINYILLTINHNNDISIYDIKNISQMKINIIPSLLRNNWELLWGNKIDYYERQISENSKKYPLITESFDYFVGMAENAISYLVNTKMEVNKEDTDNSTLSHINLKDGLFNPLNIIFDHKVRDIAEYIKYSFLYDNFDLFHKLDIYFNNTYYSLYGIRVLYARVLYPSFYFDLYDEIISGKKEEKEITNIISKIDDYEKFLYDVNKYLQKLYNIPLPEWIKKTRY